MSKPERMLRAESAMVPTVKCRGMGRNTAGRSGSGMECVAAVGDIHRFSNLN